MKEIVVISGKGGTGKTSLAASFAFIEQKSAVVADCDVDAADLHLLLDPDFAEKEQFFSGFKAKIDQEKCVSCGKCQEICRFDAIVKTDGQYSIGYDACEGCGYCSHICPSSAISMYENSVGYVFTSTARTGMPMVHASLDIGADNSGKLVAKVKKEAKAIAEKKGKSFVIVDGSPGVGCPVVASLSGAHFVVMVTEPTLSGFHDLKRVHQLIKRFGMRCGCIINKCDINAEISSEIRSFAASNSIVLIEEIPYDESFSEAITNGITIVEYGKREIEEIVKNAWNRIKENVQ